MMGFEKENDLMAQSSSGAGLELGEVSSDDK